MSREHLIRIIETDYKSLIEIPTEGWGFRQRWNWIKAIATGGDIVHRPRSLQHVDLRTKHHVEDDGHYMP